MSSSDQSSTFDDSDFYVTRESEPTAPAPSSSSVVPGPTVATTQKVLRRDLPDLKIDDIPEVLSFVELFKIKVQEPAKYKYEVLDPVAAYQWEEEQMAPPMTDANRDGRFLDGEVSDDEDMDISYQLKKIKQQEAEEEKAFELLLKAKKEESEKK